MRKTFDGLTMGLTIAAFAGTLFLTSPAAHAQDNQSHNWNGFYGGFNGGGAFGSSDFLSTVGNGFPFFEGQAYLNDPRSGVPEVIAAYRNNSDHFSTFTGGVQIGFNSFSNGWLWGLEADANALRVRTSKSTSANGLPFDAGPPNGILPATSYSFQSELDASWLVTLRPRVGVQLGSGIAYLTGGLALTDLKYRHQFRATGGAFDGLFENASVQEVRPGWTLGGGYELPVSSGATIKLEYLFTRFDDIESKDNKILGPTPAGLNPALDVACGVDTGQGQAAFRDPSIPTPRNCFSHKADLLLHMIRVGVNFKF